MWREQAGRVSSGGRRRGAIGALTAAIGLAAGFFALAPDPPEAVAPSRPAPPQVPELATSPVPRIERQAPAWKPPELETLRPRERSRSAWVAGGADARTPAETQPAPTLIGAAPLPEAPDTLSRPRPSPRVEIEPPRAPVAPGSEPAPALATRVQTPAVAPPREPDGRGASGEATIADLLDIEAPPEAGHALLGTPLDVLVREHPHLELPPPILEQSKDEREIVLDPGGETPTFAATPAFSFDGPPALAGNPLAEPGQVPSLDPDRLPQPAQAHPMPGPKAELGRDPGRPPRGPVVPDRQTRRLVPEPGPAALLTMGLVLLGLARHRRSRRAP